MSVDYSEMKEEEEKIISDLYRKELSWAKIAKNLVKRSPKWVQYKYDLVFRRMLRVVRDHLVHDLTNDQICTEVKNGNITINQFETLEEVDRKVLESSLEFILHDLNGQKRIK